MVGSKNKIGTVLKVIFILFFSFMFLLPLWLILTASFEESMSFTKNGYSLVINQFSVAAYQKLFADNLFWSSFLNSFWVTAVTVVLSLFVNTLTAYVLHEKQLPFHRMLNFLFVFTMFFNAGMIPTYLVIKSLKMTDSFLALILPASLGVYNILLIRSYLYSLPKAMEESAHMDGATHMQVLIHIILPVALPVIITTGLITLISKWNSWMDVLIYISKTDGQKFWTVQYYLRYLREAAEDPTGALRMENLLSAAIVVTVLPVVALFPVLQKYFANGIALGAVKG